jgi:hypothetical protein
VQTFLVVESIRSLKFDRSLLIATSTNGKVNVLGRWQIAKGSNIDYALEQSMSWKGLRH